NPALELSIACLQLIDIFVLPGLVRRQAVTLGLEGVDTVFQAVAFSRPRISLLLLFLIHPRAAGQAHHRQQNQQTDHDTHTRAIWPRFAARHALLPEPSSPPQARSARSLPCSGANAKRHVASPVAPS